MKRKVLFAISLVLAVLVLFSASGLAFTSVPVKTITLNTPKLSLFLGESFMLTAIVAPADATKKTVIWSTSDRKTVTVDSKGKVKALKTGSAYITAKSSDGKVSAKCNITVIKQKTLTVGTIDRYPNFSLKNNLPVWQEMEKRTGIKINWDVYLSSQYTTVMQTRIAAGGKDLPDIMLPSDDVYKLLKGGVIIPLEDLIDKYAVYAKKYFAKHPDFKALLYTPDGNIPAIIGDSIEISTAYPGGFMIRWDWLQKLNMKEPETTDDWYEMLKAFKDKDPNGNGKKDEIPMTTGGYYGFLLHFGESWGLASWLDNGFGVDKNGKVYYSYVQPKFKEVLAYINKLYKEGLLDSEFATQAGDRFYAKISNNQIGSTASYGPTGLNSTLRQAKINDGFYTLAKPPKGPYGDRMIVTEGRFAVSACITKACKDTETAIKWLDNLCYNEDSIELLTWGIKGQSFVLDEQGDYKYGPFVTDNPNKLDASTATTAFGMWPSLPFNYEYKYFSPSEKENMNKKINLPFEMDRRKEIAKFMVPGFPQVYALENEVNVLSKYQTDLNTYREEMLMKFMLGTESLGNFDKFVTKIKTLGVDELLKAKQAQYDRYKSKLK